MTPPNIIQTGNQVKIDFKKLTNFEIDPSMFFMLLLNAGIAACILINKDHIIPFSILLITPLMFTIGSIALHRFLLYKDKTRLWLSILSIVFSLLWTGLFLFQFH